MTGPATLQEIDRVIAELEELLVALHERLDDPEADSEPDP